MSIKGNMPVKLNTDKILSWCGSLSRDNRDRSSIMRMLSLSNFVELRSGSDLKEKHYEHDDDFMHFLHRLDHDLYRIENKISDGEPLTISVNANKTESGAHVDIDFKKSPVKQELQTTVPASQEPLDQGKLKKQQQEWFEEIKQQIENDYGEHDGTDVIESWREHISSCKEKPTYYSAINEEWY
jgi:hypothetical protein